MPKRPITSYFTPTPDPSKKPKLELSLELTSDLPPSTHPSYPFPIPCLPGKLELSSRRPVDKAATGEEAASGEGGGEGGANDSKDTNGSNTNDSKDSNTANTSTTSTPPTPAELPPTTVHKPDLSILHYHPFLHASLAKALYIFLRAHLPFYRVHYSIPRAGVPTVVRTPRFTSLFGVDATSTFHAASGELLDTRSSRPVPIDRYRCSPRPVPACLEVLREYVTKRTGASYNIVLVNYYADGGDSIAYHSDDERFLGENPTIASLSLGARRDFVMKHKTIPALTHTFPLPSGDLVLMQSTTQSKWLHSIPKRSSTSDAAASWAGGGRINITFRNALERGGTENYYCYNVGSGPVYCWDKVEGRMVLKA